MCQNQTHVGPGGSWATPAEGLLNGLPWTHQVLSGASVLSKYIPMAVLKHLAAETALLIKSKKTGSMLDNRQTRAHLNAATEGTQRTRKTGKSRCKRAGGKGVRSSVLQARMRITINMHPDVWKTYLKILAIDNSQK